MDFIAEAAVSTFFETLFSKIAAYEFEFVTETRVRKEIKNWETILRDIRAVLADAEAKQIWNQAVKNWLADLQDLAYDVDDILDEFATEALGRKLMKEHHASSSKAQKFKPTCFTGLHPSSIIFNYKMISKVKAITARLEGLATRKSHLNLSGVTNVGKPISMTIPRRSPSTSMVNEADIRGRDNDKKAILDLLLKNDGVDARVYSVIPIVGMGGIGKTTLAQLVYNDDNIKDHFDLRAWVCVSDEFDIIRITKTILQSDPPVPCDTNDLNLLQIKLKEKLFRKKFLLVLDDVWNQKYTDWEKLRSPFDAGQAGSKIIVTTRSSKVSSIMTTNADYILHSLSEEDSLRMLAHDALEMEDFTGHPDLEEMGLEIVKKCGGLPLAIKTIGGLLRTRVNRDAWIQIFKSDLWNLPSEESDIVPALWLSYYYLPWQLKQCFTYCCLIPKDYDFNEEEIVSLWMAEGFLNGANTKREIEDLGSKYFQELISRSFFQASSKHKSLFVMHDLINDLAQFIGGEKYFKRESHEKMTSSNHPRHFSYIMGYFDNIKNFETLFEAKSLRTFLPFDMWSIEYYNLSRNVLSDLLPRLTCLRVLSLKRYIITEIPDSIGNLRHLRYLDFSYTDIKCLPDSICTLYNLETLLLRGCGKLEEIPSKIGILEELCHLDIAHAYSLNEMPSGIGQLTNLLTLSNFIVGQGDALNISEMQNLSNLKGQLSISKLQNVNEASYACEAKLSSKPDLNNLELEWSMFFNENFRKKDVETEVLKLLRPHEELKVLAIRYYAGIAFPIWMEDPSFKNLQSLKFVNCPNCTLLPAVGKLPLLRDLYIAGMTSVTSVGIEFYGENWPHVFPSLETLHFEDMPEWEEWKACEVDDQRRKFRCLRYLHIVKCPKLKGTLPGYLPSLEKLEIFDCQKLVVSISILPMLRELKIDGCKKVVVESYTDLWLVKKITLSNILKFACVTKEMMMLESVKVEDLYVKSCEELFSLWQIVWGWLVPFRSLRNLVLENCPQVVSIGGMEEEVKTQLLQLDIEHLRIEKCESFEKLSKTLHNFSNLRELEIVKCPKLVSLLADDLPSTLKSLKIMKCENLLCLLEDAENINFSSISLLESLDIRKCEGLISLSSSSKLPSGLKTLQIGECPELQFAVQGIGGNNCLESIEIWDCKNIQYLPQRMDKLKSLHLNGCKNIQYLPQEMDNLDYLYLIHCENIQHLPQTMYKLNSLYLIQCESIHYLPQGMYKLDSLYIHGCENIQYLPQGMSKLSNLYLIGCEKLEALPSLYSLQLQLLTIENCPRVTSITEGGLPSTLTILDISGPNITKAVMERGLRELTSLADLLIEGSDDMVSFPPEEIKLPYSLNRISLSGFKNLRKLSSKCFQHLSSLQYLSLHNCPKLKSLPKKEMLHSLLVLSVSNCPVLEKRCERKKGKYWSYIADIPRVEINSYEW